MAAIPGRTDDCQSAARRLRSWHAIPAVFEGAEKSVLDAELIWPSLRRMTTSAHYHGGFPATHRLSRADARRASRALEKLIHTDPGVPVLAAKCMALGAWLRLNSGDRNFSPEMWEVVEQVIADPASTEPHPADPAVRELSDEEAWDLVQRSMILHVNIATGHFGYLDQQQNIHALLISEGMLGMLEHGRHRFAGAPMLGYIDTVGR